MSVWLWVLGLPDCLGLLLFVWFGWTFGLVFVCVLFDLLTIDFAWWLFGLFNSAVLYCCNLLCLILLLVWIVLFCLFVGACFTCGYLFLDGIGLYKDLVGCDWLTCVYYLDVW